MEQQKNVFVLQNSPPPKKGALSFSRPLFVTNEFSFFREPRAMSVGRPSGPLVGDDDDDDGTYVSYRSTST